EAPADPGDRLSVVLGAETGTHRHRANGEEHRSIVGRERLDGIEMLGRDAERDAARDEELQSPTAGGPLSDMVRRVDDLLEVVEDEKHLPVAEEGDDPVERRTLLGLFDVQRRAERREEVGRVGDVDESDKRRSVAELSRELMRELDREARL